MKLFLCLAAVAAMLLATPADVNVSGKWTGTFTADQGDGSGAYLMLKQEGNTITGSIGPSEGEQHQLAKGTISGDKVTLEIQVEEMSVRLDLVVAGEKMTGGIKMSRGAESRTGKLEVSRSK